MNYMIDEQIVQLLYKSVCVEGLNDQQAAVLNSWLANAPHRICLLNELHDEALLEEEVKSLLLIDEHSALIRLQEKIKQERLKRRKPFLYAVTILLAAALFTGIYMVHHYSKV
jgi:hypothetical protein